MIMNSSTEDAQLRQAISLARSGHKEDAHALLHKIVGENPNLEMAWLWLVQTEPDPAQQILILEECLRNNPKSEYAKKGLSSLRAQMKAANAAAKAAAREAAADKTPPPADEAKPRAPKKPSRGPSGIWKIIFVVMLLAVLATLVGGGVLLYPKIKNNLPAIQLPNLLSAANTATFTRTFTPLLPSPTDTATASLTPTVTRTRTATFTPSLTRTPTASPTATLFLGTPTAGESSLLFLAGGCDVMKIPVSGGAPQKLTGDSPLSDCNLPAISPGGKKLAFTDAPINDMILMTNLDGSQRKIITKLAANTGAGRSIWSFQWSSDGQKLAFVASSYTMGKDGINIANADFGFLYFVTLTSGYAKQLKAQGVDFARSDAISWSPNGEWIFSYDTVGADQTAYPFAFRASDSRTVWISHDALYYSHYDWSPDSQTLSSVYPKKPSSNVLPADAPADQNYIILSGLDESQLYLPLDQKGYDPEFGARWFPDGSGFLLYNEITHSLVAISKEGVLLNSILHLEKAPASISWSPDGKWIALIEKTSAGGLAGPLMIVRSDGTDLRILTRDAYAEPLVWI
jgi:hypothetical protein